MSAIKRVTALALSVLLIMTAGCSTAKVKDSNIAEGDLIISKTTTYNTAEAELTDLIKQVSSTVEPVYADRRTISSGSAPLVFVSFAVKRGDVVKLGDVLAILDGTGSPSDAEQLSLELDFQKAAYEETRAMLESSLEITKQTPAEDTYGERIKQLNIEKQTAAYELYKLNTNAALNALEERLEKAEAALKQTIITAPFDGVVRSIENKSAGDLLDPGTPLLMMSRSDSLVLFSNSAADQFMYNKQVNIKVKSGDGEKNGTGKVVSSSNLLPSYLGTFVYIKLDDQTLLGSETDAEASCDYTLLKDVIVIPRTGLNSDNGKFYVILLEGNTTRKRYIIRGPQLPAELAVFQGLKPGDLIVTSQYTS